MYDVGKVFESGFALCVKYVDGKFHNSDAFRSGKDF